MKILRVMQAENTFGKSTGVARIIQATETSGLPRNSSIYYRLSREDSEQLEIMRGLTVSATGVLHPIPPDTPPDSFEAYLKDSGIYYQFTQTSHAEVVRKASLFKRFCHRANSRFQDFLRLGEPEEKELSHIYIAMLLGQKTELSHDQSDRFRMTGTMHLFAISGLHIGVVATVIWQVLLLVRVPAKLTPALGLPLLYFYVEVTGAAPSAVRAFLMVAFFWVSIAIQRQRSPLAALAASAVFVLLIQPMQLWQMGFQLSYLVVISILLFGLPLREALWPIVRPNKYIPRTDWSAYQKGKHWLSENLLLLLMISSAAWLASAPLSAGFFGYIAPYAIIVNILLVNLAALVISTGVISLTIACLGLLSAGLFLNHSAWVCIYLMDMMVRLNLELPWATIECPDFPKSVSYLTLLVFLSSIFALAHTKHRLVRFSVPPIIIIAGLVVGLAYGGA